jgi:protein TonB
MNFAQPTQPGGKTTGLAVTIVVHVIVAYLIVSGMGRTIVNIVQKPLSVSLIEEIKPPPPEVIPELPMPAPQLPQVFTPLPPFVPPSEVSVQAPPVQNVIATSRESVPVPAPAPAAAPVAPSAAPQPVNVALACPNHMEVRSRLPYPAQAQRMGLNGEVVMAFTVGTSGQIEDVTVVKSSNPLFNNAAADAVGQLHCLGQGRQVRVRVPFLFKMAS